MLESHGLPSNFHGRPNEIADAVAIRGGRCAARISAAIPPTAARGPGADRADVRAVPRRLPRQGQPGAFLLGQLRPCRDPLLRPHRRRRIPGGIPGLPDRITREAYSHEVSSAGFWPGGVTAAEPIFYSYAYPEPRGFRGSAMTRRPPGSTRHLANLYCPMKPSAPPRDPERDADAFLQSTYEAAANLAELGPCGARARAGRASSWRRTGRAKSSSWSGRPPASARPAASRDRRSRSAGRWRRPGRPASPARWPNHRLGAAQLVGMADVAAEADRQQARRDRSVLIGRSMVRATVK